MEIRRNISEKIDVVLTVEINNIERFSQFSERLMTKVVTPNGSPTHSTAVQRP